MSPGDYAQEDVAYGLLGSHHDSRDAAGKRPKAVLKPLSIRRLVARMRRSRSTCVMLTNLALFDFDTGTASRTAAGATISRLQMPARPSTEAVLGSVGAGTLLHIAGADGTAALVWYY